MWEQLIDVLKAIFFQPAVAMPFAVLALTTLVRTFLGAKWPHFEDSSWYKFTLALAQIVIGVAVAVLCRLGGVLHGLKGEDLGWAYVVIVGVVVGWASAWIWGLAKPALKKLLKLTDKDIEDRKSKSPADGKK